MNLSGNTAFSVIFDFKLKNDYMDGYAALQREDTLFEIPGLGRYHIVCENIAFYKDDPLVVEQIKLEFCWDNPDFGAPITALIPQIPGKEVFRFLFTCDMNKKCSLYINGIHHAPADIPEFSLKEATCSEIIFNGDIADISDIQIIDKYIQNEEIKPYFGEFHKTSCKFMGNLSAVSPWDFENLKGELLYEKPLTSPSDIAEWVVDSGITSFPDGYLRIESECPGAPGMDTGHMTIWCDKIFPESFVLQFDSRVIKPHLAIVFFAAKGIDGIDMFDPQMPERRGEFSHYIKGKITSYHISYFTSGRGRSNLRKNNKFYLAATGEAAAEGVNVFHTITVVKRRDHIQAFADNALMIDFEDNHAARYGEYHKEGRIGLRHMKNGSEEYRNFRVWAIKE